ncbi:MAG TPA: YbaY family lipoprotein [Pyrinomonadaceae bacterium]|nr:YbaY family lipoprotein [Pyrinomonadaceae bacterium]
MTRVVSLILLTGLLAFAAIGQTMSWLDRPLTRNWNTANQNVPRAPRMMGTTPNSVECREQIRQPETLAERELTRNGWFLFGPRQSYGNVSVVTAMASVDGMCRPTQVNGFVFVSERLAGTLAPEPTGARVDGAFSRLFLVSPTALTAEFVRYTSSDADCCPSQVSTVSYSIPTGARPVLAAENVTTAASCETERDDGEVTTQDNVVSGTVTYPARPLLSNGAILTVELVDITHSLTDPSTVVTQRIPLLNNRQPHSFDLVYDQKQIMQGRRYAVRAEITDRNRTIFTTSENVPVLTWGHPRVVELRLSAPGATIPGTGSAIVRGTVTYLPRVALAPNSEVRVLLVDSADPNGIPVAETTVQTSGRQVPIPYELRYDPRNIISGRNYELRAEIQTDGQVRFRTGDGTQFISRPNQVQTVNLTLGIADAIPEVITGRTLNLAKFGTGSMQIEGRGSELLIRATVAVRSDGNADVTVSRLLGSITFSGKVTYFDDNRVVVAVENSGNADASGLIEIRYSGNSLNAITATDLVLDSQSVTLRF